MEEFSVIGKRFPAVNSLEKVTGEAKYASDIKLPRMLYGKFLRSPYAHARILSIDTSKAKKLSGVKAVITGRDIPKVKFGPVIQDQYALAIDKVLHIGAEVAAVAAISQDIADEAISLIKVYYEELPAVFDVQEAMQPGAPIIHESAKDNIAYHMPFKAGNVEEAFESSDFIFEDEFRTQAVQHCCMETQGCVASFRGDKLTVWANTSTPFNLVRHLALTLGIPKGNIRVIRTYTGGSFGSKSDYPPTFTCASLMSRITGRPVRFVLNREEEFAYSVLRHPFIIRLKTGVTKDGKIKAFDAKVLVDNGAYSSYGPFVCMQSATILCSLYRDTAVSYDISLVYTNKVRTGAFRGFGGAQAQFASESQMDMIAEKLGMSPMDIRLKNIVRPGDVTGCHWKITSCGLKECLEKAVEKSEWKEKWGKEKRDEADNNGVVRTGVGMAVFMHHCGFKGGDNDSSAAFVKLRDDKKVYVISGASDVGQGCDTIFAAIVAETLGLPLDDIVVTPVDTFYSPLDMGSYASRVTVYAGNAVRAAALDLRRQIFEVVAKELEVDVRDLEAKNRRIYIKSKPDKGLSFEEAYMACQAAGTGFELLGKGFYNPPTEILNPLTGYANYSITYPFGALVAEVEVNTETGIVRVTKLTSAHDLGRAISLNGAEGQVEGANVMGMGYALSEATAWQGGRVLNPNFADYRMLTAADIPPMETILVEPVDPDGPFGGKGHSEAALDPLAPAIRNAIHDAIGVWINEIPMTPEKVLKALEKKAAGEK